MSLKKFNLNTVSNFFHRFVIILGIIITFVAPVSPLLNPNITYMLPMELNFTRDHFFNFCINFGIQTVAHINVISFFITNFSLFYLICTNLTFELKFIAGTTKKIGNIEAKRAPTSKHQLIKSMGNQVKAKPVTQYDTKTLLNVILKYHEQAIA